MTRIISIEGCSDDHLIIGGTTKGEDDQVDCFDAKAFVKITEGEKGILLVCEYAAHGNGCWSYAFTPIEEDHPLLEVTDIKINGMCRGYQLDMSFAIPDAASIKSYAV